MVIYLAVSSDTTTGNSAYAYKIENASSVSRKETNSTGPRELLRGLIAIFDDLIRSGTDARVDDIAIITNNQFIIMMINDDQISTWKNNEWVKSSGEEVASKDLLMQLYNYIAYFKERNKKPFLARPVNEVEEANLKAVSRVALNRRKY